MLVLVASAFIFAGFFILIYWCAAPLSAWFKNHTRRDAQRFTRWADELYMEWSPAFIMKLSLGVNVGIIILALATFFITGSVLFTFFIGGILYWAPKVIYQTIRDKRLKKIEEQLPDAVNVMVATVRAGSPLPHAVKAVADKTSDPIRREFEVIITEHFKGGLMLEDALDRARKRLRTESFSMICSALIINSAQGGDVLHVLEKMSTSIRELTRLKKKILTETTEIRAQEKIIIFMTPLFFILICSFDPVIPDILFNTIAGQLILVIVVIIQIAAILWIQRIVKTAI